MVGAEKLIDDRVIGKLVEDIGPEAAQRLLQSFMNEARRRMVNIAQAATAEDLSRLHEQAHTLKGSAASFGAASLERIVGEIAAACAAADARAALARIDDLSRTVRATLKDLEARIAQGPENGDTLSRDSGGTS